MALGYYLTVGLFNNSETSNSHVITKLDCKPVKSNHHTKFSVKFYENKHMRLPQGPPTLISLEITFRSCNSVGEDLLEEEKCQVCHKTR